MNSCLACEDVLDQCGSGICPGSLYMSTVPSTLAARVRGTLPLMAMIVSVGMLVPLALMGKQSLVEVPALVNGAREVERRARDLRDLLILVRRAEASQRGFLIAGAQRYLEPYDDSLVAIPPLLERIRGSAASSGDASRFAELKADVITKLDDLALTIRISRDSGLEAARSEVLTDRGRHAMRRIEAVIAGWQREQYEVLEHRRDGALEAIATLNRVGTVGVSLVAGLLTLAAVMTVRERRLRRIAEVQSAMAREALAKSNKDLSRRNLAYLQAMKEVAFRYDWSQATVHWEGDTTDILGEDWIGRSTPLAEWNARIHPEDLPAYMAEGERRRRSRGLFRLTIRVRQQDGSWRWVEQRGIIQHDSAGEGVETIGVFRNVDELVKAEQERTAAAQQFDALLASIRDGFLALDGEWTYVYVNETAARILHKARSEMIGRELWAVFPTARTLPFHDTCQRVRSTGEPEALEQYFAATQRWYLNHVYPFGAGVSIFIEDITDRKVAEQERDEARQRLEQFTEQLDRTIESERTEIARRIHDELGQAMTALKYDVAWVKRRVGSATVPDPGPVIDQLDAMNRHIDDTVTIARGLARDLRPAVLSDLGLAAALRTHALEWSARSGVVCECRTADVDLPAATESALYRIVIEACTNILRHARARRAWVRLEMDGHAVHLEIGDDGIGFDPDGPLRRGSLGLLGITERAVLLGGQAIIDAAPGCGTRIHVHVPLVALSQTVTS